MPSIFNQFKHFMKEYSVSAVAIGIIMAIAVKDYAKALVDDFIMPLANLFLPGTDWTEWVLYLGPAKIKGGHLLASSVNFLIICFVVFLFAKVATRRMRK